MKQVATVNLTTEPVSKTDKKGAQYMAFGAAEDLKKKNPDGTFVKTGVRYYNVTAYGKYAMDVALALAKGDRVEISGEASLGTGEKKINFFKMKDAKVIFKKENKFAA